MHQVFGHREGSRSPHCKLDQFGAQLSVGQLGLHRFIERTVFPPPVGDSPYPSSWAVRQLAFMTLAGSPESTRGSWESAMGRMRARQSDPGPPHRRATDFRRAIHGLLWTTRACALERPCALRGSTNRIPPSGSPEPRGRSGAGASPIRRGRIPDPARARPRSGAGASPIRRGRVPDPARAHPRSGARASPIRRGRIRFQGNHLGRSGAFCGHVMQSPSDRDAESFDRSG